MLFNIQFLRFVAATLVVLYHTAAFMPDVDHPLSALFSFGTAAGFAGVDVFFVISGFIMAWTTRDHGGGAEAWDFARRRVARIYSGYWPFFFLALAVFTWAREEHVEQAKLLVSFFLWPQPLNLNLLEISWTLSFEMYFYLLFTLLVWWLPPSRRVLVCALVLTIVVLFNAWRHLVIDAYSPENYYFLSFWDLFLTSPFISQFFAGAVAAWWLAAHPRGPAWTWLGTGVAMFMAAGALNVYGYVGLIEQGFYVVPRTAVFGVAALMMVVGLVRLEQAGRVAPVRFSLLGGGASYAIYLLHVPFIVAAHHLGLAEWATRQSGLVVSLSYLGLVLGILVVSMTWYGLAERRLHQLFRRAMGFARN